MRGFPLFVCLLSGFLQLVESKAGAAVSITATAIFPYLPLGQKSDGFQVLLRVEAPADAPTKPGAVAVVLDVSNDKIGYVNAAAGHVKQTAAGDIAFYVRSSNMAAGWVEVDALEEFQAAGRPAVGGHTAEGGLGMAHRYLSDKAGAGRSIILVTDAQDKTGILYDKLDVAVHILDVGVGHDAMLHLHSMFIKEKGGTYSFVEEHEDKAELASALAVLVAGLKEVAIPAKTRVTLGATVTVSHVQRGGINVPLATDEKDAFDIDVLYAGEVKNFIVYLDVAESFTPSRRQACKEKQLLLQCSVVGGSTTDVYITRPQDDGYLLPMPMPMPTVVHHIVEFELLQIVNELVLVEDLSAEQLSTALTAKWAVLVNKHRFEVGWDLAGLQAKIHMIQAYLKKEHVSYSYIFSWASGYQAQRPTILGSWENHLTVFVDNTAIKRWTKVVVNVNVKMQLHDGTICARAAACKAPEHVLFVEGSKPGTFILNPAYERTQLVKLNTVFKELFQAGCNAVEVARVADGMDGASPV